jgi:hypothetical protein
MNTRKTIYDKLFTEKVELAKHEVELATIKVELADNVMTLLTKAQNGKKQVLEAKKAIIDLKSMAKSVADKVDNFVNGAYIDVVIKGKDTIAAAKALGLGDSPQIQKLIAVSDELSKYRGELKNGSDYLIK